MLPMLRCCTKRNKCKPIHHSKPKIYVLSISQFEMYRLLGPRRLLQAQFSLRCISYNRMHFHRYSSLTSLATFTALKPPQKSTFSHGYIDQSSRPLFTCTASSSSSSNIPSSGSLSQYAPVLSPFIPWYSCVHNPFENSIYLQLMLISPCPPSYREICSVKVAILDVPGALAEELGDMLLAEGATSVSVEEFRPEGAPEEKIFANDPSIGPEKRVWERCTVAGYFPEEVRNNKSVLIYSINSVFIGL